MQYTTSASFFFTESKPRIYDRLSVRKHYFPRNPEESIWLQCILLLAHLLALFISRTCRRAFVYPQLQPVMVRAWMPRHRAFSALSLCRPLIRELLHEFISAKNTFWNTCWLYSWNMRQDARQRRMSIQHFSAEYTYLQCLSAGRKQMFRLWAANGPREFDILLQSHVEMVQSTFHCQIDKESTAQNAIIGILYSQRYGICHTVLHAPPC